MKKIILAAFLGGTLGIFSAVKLAGPVLAENNTDKADVYEQLDLFGDIFDRIQPLASFLFRLRNKTSLAQTNLVLGIQLLIRLVNVCRRCTSAF